MTVVKELEDESRTHLECMCLPSVRAPAFGNDRMVWKRLLRIVQSKLGESRLIPTSVQVSITPTHHHVILPLDAFFFFALEFHITFPICLGFFGPEHPNDISPSSSWEPHSEECGYLFFSWSHVYSKTIRFAPQK